MVRPDSPLGKQSYWIVVADEYRATFFSRTKKLSPLDQQQELVNDVAREKTGDLISDKGGRAFDSHGQGRHTMAGEKDDPKTHAASAFARTVAESVAAARQRHRFDRLVVVAAPRFLGLLRPALASAGVDIELAIDKEMTGQSVEAVQKLVDDSYP